jgi:DNA oxidative demethylase
MTLPLQFGAATPDVVVLEPGISLLRRFADTTVLYAEIQRVAVQSPFRHLTTPGGGTMSVAMSNCGPLGWVSDSKGYRYAEVDPLTGAPWPKMPEAFAALADAAAAKAGFASFAPDACLINRYEAGARMGAHRDADEADFAQPIVSVSIGLPAQFVFYGLQRGGKGNAQLLEDGDVLVWGGPARLRYHAVRPIKAGTHALTGNLRYNLTFRSAR